MISIQDMEEAWRRLGCTVDGKLARALLMEILMQVPPPGCPPGALHEDLGRRTLARRLILLLDEAPNPDARPAFPDPGQPLARARHSAGTDAPRGVRRRRIAGAVDSEPGGPA